MPLPTSSPASYSEAVANRIPESADVPPAGPIADRRLMIDDCAQSARFGGLSIVNRQSQIGNEPAVPSVSVALPALLTARSQVERAPLCPRVREMGRRETRFKTRHPPRGLYATLATNPNLYPIGAKTRKSQIQGEMRVKRRPNWTSKTNPDEPIFGRSFGGER